MRRETQTLSVIDLGYVELPLAILAAKKGYKVFGIDLNKEKVRQINSGISPFKDNSVADDLKKLP